MPMGHLYKFLGSIQKPDRNHITTSGNLLRNKEDGFVYYRDDAQKTHFASHGEWIEWEKHDIPLHFEKVDVYPEAQAERQAERETTYEPQPKSEPKSKTTTHPVLQRFK
eukprot:m.133499 g.133499  ORF g.133499 m.133499 type:complete len:109 (-) comp15801_c3_seq1:192-518(-)